METIFSFVFFYHFSVIGMLTTHLKLNQCDQFIWNTFNIGYRFGFRAHTHKKVNGRDVSSKEDAETLFSENKNAVTLLVSRSLYTVSSIICLKPKKKWRIKLVLLWATQIYVFWRLIFFCVTETSAGQIGRKTKKALNNQILNHENIKIKNNG